MKLCPELGSFVRGKRLETSYTLPMSKFLCFNTYMFIDHLIKAETQVDALWRLFCNETMLRNK